MNLWTIFVLLLLFVLPISSELISLIAGSSLIGAVTVGLGYLGYQKCIFDCCSELRPINEIGESTKFECF